MTKASPSRCWGKSSSPLQTWSKASAWQSLRGSARSQAPWKVMLFQYLHSKVSLSVGTESSSPAIYFCQGLLLGGGEALEDTSLAMMIPSKSHSLPQYQGLPQLLADSHVCWSTQLPSRVLYPRETEQGQGIFSTASNKASLFHCCPVALISYSWSLTAQLSSWQQHEIMS